MADRTVGSGGSPGGARDGAPAQSTVPGRTGRLSAVISRLDEINAKAQEVHGTLGGVESAAAATSNKARDLISKPTAQLQEFMFLIESFDFSTFMGQSETVTEKVSDLKKDISFFDQQIQSAGESMGNALTSIGDQIGSVNNAAAACNTNTSGAMNQLKDSVLQLLDQVLQGFASTEAAAKVFGPGILKYLPSNGEVQERIRNLIATATTGANQMQKLVALLAEQNNKFAQDFTKLIAAFNAGTVSLQTLIERATALKNALPDGSATEQIIDEILNNLLQGGP